MQFCRSRWCKLREWFTVHPREEELKDSAPEEVRSASHDLANTAMKVQQRSNEVTRHANALKDLVERMQSRYH